MINSYFIIPRITQILRLPMLLFPSKDHIHRNSLVSSLLKIHHTNYDLFLHFYLKKLIHKLKTHELFRINSFALNHQ